MPVRMRMNVSGLSLATYPRDRLSCLSRRSLSGNLAILNMVTNCHSIAIAIAIGFGVFSSEELRIAPTRLSPPKSESTNKNDTVVENVNAYSNWLMHANTTKINRGRLSVLRLCWIRQGLKSFKLASLPRDLCCTSSGRQPVGMNHNLNLSLILRVSIASRSKD